MNDEGRNNKVSCKNDRVKREITLSNGLVTRKFSYREGFRTTSLVFAPDGRNLVDPRHRLGIHGGTREATAPCREVLLGLDATDYNIGLADGFSFEDCRSARGENDNVITTFRLRRDELKLEINFELCAGQPFMVKWVELQNGGRRPVSVTACQPEALTLPNQGGHRWRECTRKVYPTGHVAQPTRRPFFFWHENYSPAENQPLIWVDHFTSRAQEFGFALATNYVREAFARGFETAGRDINLPSLPGMICSCGHRNPGEVFTQFPVGPNVVLEPGKKFVSFKTYLVFFEGGYEDGGLALRRMVKRLCPWTAKFHTRFEHTYWTRSASEKIRKTGKFDMSLLQHSIDQAAEAGFDYWYFTLTLWAQSFGDYRPRPEFPGGARDMKKVVDYAHRKGLKVGIHAAEAYGVDFPDHYLLDEATGQVNSYDIGAAGDFIRKHPDYRLLDRHGNQARGWVMCGASGFHEHLLRKKIRLAQSIGCDLLDNDGPYYGDPCYARNHKHRNPEEAQYLNWRLALERYRAYRAAGFHVIAPDGFQSLFNGNAANPTYHTETTTRFDPCDFIRDLRVCLYKSTFYMPATAMYYSVWCDPAVMNGIDVTRKARLLDYYFASIATYGVNLGMLGLRVYTSETVRKTVKKWLEFMKEHAEILCGEVVHLAEPAANNIDAVMHVAPGKDVCGLLAGFNSADHALGRDFVIPARYLEADRIILREAWSAKPAREYQAVNGAFVVRVSIPARSYKILLANR